MGTWATDVDFEEMTIEYLLLGCTRGTLETDAYFWDMGTQIVSVFKESCSGHKKSK